jgi:hypothetical protein
MTPKPRSRVEKVAEETHTCGGTFTPTERALILTGACNDIAVPDLRKLARFVLARERAARGKTIGWAVVNQKAHGPMRCCGTVYQTKFVADTGWRQSWRGGRLARCVYVPPKRKRVVLEPRRGKGKR